jgi:DNA repair protein RecN (Recombination protein N)
MLLELNISNFALIDNVRLSLEDGLNVLTGETGAGKSIIIDAVNLVLGERADTDVIRTGAKKAVVEALFECSEIDGTDSILESLGIEPEPDKTVVLSREIRSGRSISRINGRTVPLSSVKQLGRHLIDIHGQHQHQSLLDVHNHLDTLDQFGGREITKTRNKTSSMYERLVRLEKELEKSVRNEMERERNIDLYSYQVREIEDANLETGEEEGLTKRREVMVNAEKIYQSLAQSYQLLYGDDDSVGTTVTNGIGQVNALLSPYADMDDRIAGFQRIAETSYHSLREMSRDIRSFLEGFEFDRTKLNSVEERLDLINRLKRKYGRTIEEILEYRDKRYAELEKLKNSEQQQQRIRTEIDELERDLKRECKVLSGLRKKAADYLAETVTSEIVKLGMNNGAFAVDMKQAERFTAKGTDVVEFLFSANLGEPLKSLNKIASGGEMSRIMLAIKRCLADTDRIPTLIFDEIDSGISGRTAQVVAQQLAAVSKKHQVVCVTHLPQIAAMADNHYMIIKEEKGGKTQTRLKVLDRNQKIKELARLMGGAKVTELTIRHSEEMLKMAETIKGRAK